VADLGVESPPRQPAPGLPTPPRQSAPGLPIISLDGEPLAIRGYEPGDRSFVLSTWVQSGRLTSHTSRDVYLAHEPRLAERLVRECPVLVLCSPRRTSTILAWACIDGDVLHFAYVVPELRRRGVLKALVVAARGEYPARVDCSHRLPFGSARFRFNPYVLMARAA
jgi:hypothetical protein